MNFAEDARLAGNDAVELDTIAIFFAGLQEIGIARNHLMHRLDL